MALLSRNTKIDDKKPLLVSYKISSKHINLNTYINEGIYLFKDLMFADNFPMEYDWTGNNSSHLQVFTFDLNNSSKVMQILTRYNSNNLFIRYSYINESNNVIWSKWSIIGESNKPSDSLECFQYYNDFNIKPSDEEYFILSNDGTSIIGLSIDGKKQPELVVPYKIKNKYIKTIGDNAFKDNTNVIKVVLPKSIISINNSAFNGCTKLEYINFPNTLTNIGEYAFSNTKLNNILIPDSISYIDDYAFANCDFITTVKFPKSLINIGSKIFHNTDTSKIIIYCEQNSVAEQFAKDNNIKIMYTDISNLGTHRNFALKTKDDIPSDIKAGDICFIWDQFDTSSDIDSFKAAQYTNMPIGYAIPTDEETEYFGLITSESKPGRNWQEGGLVSAEMEVAKTPSGTKVFFNKI